MEHLVENSGIHCASDLLRDLRNELMKLGETDIQTSKASQPQYTRPPATQTVTQAAAHIRVDGELYATQLEILRAEEEQSLCERIREEQAAAVAVRESLQADYEEGCNQVDREWAADLEVIRQEYVIACSVMGAKQRRLLVVQKRTEEALALLEHNQLVASLDSELFGKDAARMKRYHKAEEKKRREAEEVERAYMNSIKMELAPDGAALRNVPFLLTSFERHL